MTKAELIRKIVKRSGIPDSEAKVFFEIFLQKASALLRPGQAVKLKGFGYFQLRLAVFKTTSFKPSAKINQINTEVIVFSPFEESGGEGLIFNIPAVVTGRYNYIDSYFSLSIGRPIIPLQGVKDTDYFIVPTGYEMKKLIESKVDKLLEDIEIVKDYVKNNEVLFLKKNSFSAEPGEESDWSIGKLDNGNLNVSPDEKSSDIPNDDTGEKINYSNVTWDFGQDLSRQIEEEAIIDESLEPQSTQLIEEPEIKNSLGWNFGEQVLAEEPAEIEQEEPDITEVIESNDNDDNDDFLRVKAITAEFKFDENKSDSTKTEDNLAWDFGEDELKENDSEDDVGAEKFEYSHETEVEDTKNVIAENKPEIPQVIIPEKQPESTKPAAAEVKKIIIPQNAGDKIGVKDSYSSKNKSLLPFLIAMFTIILVSVTLYMYLNKISLYDVSTGKFLKASRQNVAGITPVVVDRNFDVPVNYPYPKDSKQNVPDNDTGLSAAINVKSMEPAKTVVNNKPAIASNVKEKPAAVPVKNNKTQPPASVSKTPVTKEVSQKINNNIFQQGKNYLVQVSSWQSRARAENEAAKFKAKGYTASIEQAEISGRGTWFRVKIGNFKSASEAEKFSQKYK